MRKLITFIALFLPVAGYCADAGEVNIRVLDALTGEYATCAAYYGILSRAASISGEREAVDRNDRLRERAIIFALTFARKAHGDQAARAVTTDRIDAAIDRHFAYMSGNISLLPVLSGRYAQHCRQALENPGPFADTVLKRTVD
jgi:hypothetical protein